MAASTHSRKALSTEEIECTLNCLERHGGDRKAAAHELGLSYYALYSRLKRLGVEGKKGRPRRTLKITQNPSQPKPEGAHEHALWNMYAQQRDLATRNQLVVLHLELAKQMAIALFRKVPLDFDTLHSAAHEGLIDAVEKFDPGRGLKFSSFAQPRIYGSMIDEIRKLDHVPRRTRTQAKRMEDARRQITQQQGRDATDDEIAAELKLSSWDIREGMPRGLDSLEQITFSSPNKDSRETSARDTITDADADRPTTAWGRDQLFRDLTRGCTLMEQTILWLYHIHGTTMKQIGIVLDLSESRVSQLHTALLARLKAQHDRTKAWETYRALVG